MSDLTLRELMKLSKMKMSDLATELNMEYGHLSTAVSMDEKGETPKREAVRQRIELVREHLSHLVSFDQAPAKKGADWWSDFELAAKRWPAPLNCIQEFTTEGYVLGQYVRLALDPDGNPELYRFLRVVKNVVSGRVWVDVAGGASGGIRSLTLDELAVGRRDHG